MPRQKKRNMFEAIQKMDGNPGSPEEFDISPHDEDEVYFRADEEASEAMKNRVLLLNFIHKELHHKTQRFVPVLTESVKDVEIYHQIEYQDAMLDVCVYWPPAVEGEAKSSIAMVKFTSLDLSGQSREDVWAQYEETGIVIPESVPSKKDGKKDNFTAKVEDMTKNYWAPRWKYVVNSLRHIMTNYFDKNGVETIHSESEPEEDKGGDGGHGAKDNGEEVEEEMTYSAGATGKIIGAAGAMINEIRKATKIKDINMPKKEPGAKRGRARDQAVLTLVGTRTAVDEAKDMIKAIVDEWTNAPRRPRDGGASYGAFDQTPAVDEAQDATDGAGGNGSWDDGSGATGGGNGGWNDGSGAAAGGGW